MSRSVLLAASLQDGRRWQSRYPNRWDRVVCANAGEYGARGVQATSVDITPLANRVPGVMAALKHATFPGAVHSVPISDLRS